MCFNRYTIVHPGGLLDKPEGERTLLVDVDDNLLSTQTRSVPRGDVAAVVVGCLGLAAALDTAFDLASKDDQEGGEATRDVAALLKSLGGKSCDYTVNQDDVNSLDGGQEETTATSVEEPVRDKTDAWYSW